MRPGPAPDGQEIRTSVDALARADRLIEPQMAALEAYRSGIEARVGPTPHADPADGGCKANLLILLETPGPRGPVPRFVSCDNPTGTARNLRRFLSLAGLDRRRILLWNVVPWLIHAPGAHNRAPRRHEIAAGLALLPDLLTLLPDLRAIVTAGRIAAEAAPVLADLCPGGPVFAMPHPSPTYVCTSPAVAVRIVDTLRAAANAIESR